MQHDATEQYKSVLTELIKKQMVILGPDITLLKVKNVKGLTVNTDGSVLSLEGDPKQILQDLINQFVELSGMIVKKVMESIIASNPGVSALADLSTGVPSQTPSPMLNESLDSEKEKQEREKAQAMLNEATQELESKKTDNGSNQ